MIVHEDKRGYGVGGGAETMLRDVTHALELRDHTVTWYQGDGAFETAIMEEQPDVCMVMTVHNFLGFGPVRWLQGHGYPHVWALMDYWPFCGNRMLLLDEDEGCEAVTGVCQETCVRRPCTSLCQQPGRATAYYLPLVNRSPVMALNEYTAAIYRRNGLRCDYVVPLGTDHEYFVPAPEQRVPGRILTMSAWPSYKTKGMHILGAACRRIGATARLITGQPRERVRELLQTGDVFAFPSCYEETWGLCLTEAMACGLACIASSVCGTRAQIEDGVNGLLVPPRDVGALADALERLMADEGLRRRLGAAARATVEERMTLEHVGERLVAVYKEIIDGRT